MTSLSLLSEVFDRQRSLIGQWRALDTRQRWTVAAIIAGFILLLVSLQYERHAAGVAVVRQQFHLPPNVAIAQIRVQQPKNASPLEAIVRFTDEHYRAYEARLNDPNIWRPTPSEFGRRTIAGAFAANALLWREQPPLPRRAGDTLADWGSLSREQASAIANGRHFCFVMVEAPNDSARAVSCWDLSATDQYTLKVHGALDPATRTLHVIIR